jgi:AcrR family transcriptional regulator
MPVSLRGTSDRPRSRREERRERELELRRADVLAAAAAEFAEKGFDGAQMSALAARAEVALGTLYSLFESKEQLFQAVIETSANAVRDAVQAEVMAVAGARERLLHLVDVCFERFRNEPVFFRIYTQSTAGWPARIRAAMGESAHAQFSEFGEWIVGLARDAAAAGALRGVDPETFGLALMGALVNVTAAITAGTASRSVETHAAGVRALFDRLLAPTESSP